MVKNCLPMKEMQEMTVRLTSGLERYPGGGNGNPFQYFCLENPMDRGSLWDTVHEVAELDTTDPGFSRGVRRLK